MKRETSSPPDALLAGGMICRSMLLGCVVGSLLISHAAAEETRTWKDSSGKFELKAEFIKQFEGKIYLRDEAGQEIAIPRTKLSPADLDYLAKKLDSNPFQPLAPDVEVPTSLLAVNYRIDTRELLTPGLVCSVSEGQAYVLAMVQINHQQFPGMPAPSIPEKFVAVWDREQEQQKVELELMFVDHQNQLFLLRGPAKDLPHPLIGNEFAPKIAEKQTCQIVGMRPDQQRSAIANVQSPATISNVYRTLDGKLKQFVLQPPESFRCYWGVVLNDQGQQIGLIAGKLGSVQQPTPGIVACPLEMANYWAEPAIVKMHLFPVAGDAKTITWEVLVEYTDPFKKLNRPVLFCKLQNGIRNPLPPGATKAADEKPGTPFDKSASRIELKPGKPTELFQAFLKKTHPHPIGNALLGRFETPNPGLTGSEYYFKCQLAYQLAGQKEATWKPAETLYFRPRNLTNVNGTSIAVQFGEDQSPTSKEREREAIKEALRGPVTKTYETITLPNIPGLNGHPVDIPPIEKADTGYLVTSATTRLDPPLAGKVPASAPQPNKESRDLRGKPAQNGPYQITQLNVAVHNGPFPRKTSPAMTVSGDGKWIYLVDADNLLYRINAQNLALTATLKLDSPPAKMAYSRHGLLISFPEKKVLWQVDATTLQVKREFEIPGLMHLAASANTDLCFVTFPAKRGGSDEIGLGLIDLAQGKMLHVIENQYESGGFFTPIGTPLPSNSAKSMQIQVTSDGKYLLMSGNTLRRFKIRDKELILEQVRRRDALNTEGDFAVSGDGSLIGNSIDRRTASLGYGTLTLLNGMDLDARPIDLVRVPSPIAVAFGDDSKSVYCVQGGGRADPTPANCLLHHYSIEGEKQFTLVLEDMDVRQIFVLAGGKRILANGSHAFIVYEIPRFDAAKKAPEKK